MVNCELAGTGGHKIESLVVGEALAPRDVKVYEYKVMCIRCGRSLEEIKAPVKQTRGPRKKKLEVPLLVSPDGKVPGNPVSVNPESLD